ncbi:hypothetical protein ACRAWG_28915 [Methylobacterium sp. P31]
MTRRRDSGRTRPPLPDTLPDRDAVERALEAVLDRLRPKPAGTAGPAPGRVGPRRKTRPDEAGT